MYLLSQVLAQHAGLIAVLGTGQLVSIRELTANHEALERRFGTSITFHESCSEYAKHFPNRFRAVENPEDFFTAWVPVWADDVSGARSKQYQKYLDNSCNKNILGLGAIKFCRQSSRPGRPRNVEGIRGCVLAQLRLATYGIASRVEELQASMGTKNKIAQHWIDILIQTAREAQAASPGRSVDDLSNELLVWLGNKTDQPDNHPLHVPYTLVEILHKILLRSAKYTRYDLHHNWTAARQDTFMVRLLGTNLDELRVPPIRTTYIMQYRNGLQLMSEPKARTKISRFGHFVNSATDSLISRSVLVGLH
ncbi:hypothetical protein B0H13DRAFT_1866409 [Mycena leptocephala]|nr:hypothetical protein B0H13DRAFT_1866409 [Mycena leptocephala]